MSFPGFPPGLPRLPADAPPLTDSDRAYIAGLKPHQRAEAEWTLRSVAAAFDRAAAVRAARQIAETNVRTDEVERRRKGLAA